MADKRKQQQNAISKIISGSDRKQPQEAVSDLDQGTIRPTGVGLREGEIAAIDAIGAELGANLGSDPIARNALIRIATRKLITDLRSGVITYDDLAAYFKIPDKPKPKLNL